MTDSAKVESFAVRQRRASQRQEWTEQTKLAGLLAKYLDPACTFWTALENKPISRVSGVFQKRRGVRSGLPDVYVLYRGKSIFLELKSRRGVASKAQKQIRLEMQPAGAVWLMTRSARAALMACRRRRTWRRSDGRRGGGLHGDDGSCSKRTARERPLS